jgi:sialate O-acetylesterase
MRLKLPAVFSDHMVLQHGIPLPVWGWAKPGQTVAVAIAGRTAEAVAGDDGRWMARLPPLAAGGPFTLHVATDGKAIAVEDVMVGEVWICSGQSNMEWTLASARDGAAETAAADYPNLRLFSVPHVAETTAQADVKAAWCRCRPDTAGAFSAVGYFFGRELHRKTGMPIGLINSSWGGTYAEAWTSRDFLLTDPVQRQVVEQYEDELRNPNSLGREVQARLDAWRQANERTDTSNAGQTKGWHKPECKTAGWKTMDLPRPWQSAGHPGSGIFWFRREVVIPAAWKGKDLVIHLGPTDKSDVTYFNGVQVGSITMEQRADAWSTPRVYTIPGKLVKAGRNHIAVRVWSNIYAGGFIGQPGMMRLEPPAGSPDAAIPLAGPWRYQVEADFGLVPPPPPGARGKGNPNSPYILFDSMIKPLLPFAIRGAIWYQGESNADKAKQYRTLFPLMIRSWHAAWGQGTFPFHFVQLANFQAECTAPGDSKWAELREAQTQALALPGTAMAVAIDIGDANDIHPRNKQDVGLRLALPALERIHGFRGLVHSGPIYRGATVEKDRIRIAFDHVSGGLVARGGPLAGFAIAGKDRTFVWAEAAIDGDTVVVSSPSVPKPVAVRYAWAENPRCNLYNASDLPASPFRTDDWPGISG